MGLVQGDGSPIVANGDQVVAFKSTEKQYKDSLLFNPSSNTTYNNEPGGMGVVPDAWSEQYGERTAITKLPEIAALSSDAASQAEQIDRLRVLASGGINSDIDLKLLAELMPVGGVGKGALLSAIKELAARDALAVKGTEAIAGKAAETVAGKGIESAAGKGLDAAAGKGTEQFANQAQAKLAGYSPCCFAAGTMVATPDGERAIDALRVGDVVWTKPEEGGEPFASKVSATHIRTDQPIYQLTLVKNGSAGEGLTETLQVTPGHPFYVPARKGFVPLIELKPGDQLQSLGDGATQEASISIVSIKLLQSQGKTYNLTVDIGHTFYVGKLSTWVHNVGPCYTCNAGSCSVHGLDSSATDGVPQNWNRQDTPTAETIKVDSSKSVKGSPEYEMLNNPEARMPNQRYELDNGTTSVTDSRGLVEELTFTPVDIKVPRDARQTAAGKTGRETDVGGHAQACSQGGTCDGYNLFAQDQNFNSSAYKVFYEHKIKSALNDPNKVVGPTTIKFNREDPRSLRPDTLDVTYTIDGKRQTVRFENEARRIPEHKE
ncbi:polymorphic toxin-type HINT domain-containing protein [Pseudomonas poae]|uniref:polymorphic toxin-type HINT domain-containing protein n=1 Tax=Pseudomonas poae TaxID=200451 RepID=UPI0030D1DF59